MTSVLVTGATGFIGAHLVPKLRERSFDVVTANRHSGDVADASTWSSLPDADTVVHLAGKTFVPDSWKDPSAFIRTNLMGTIAALDYCATRRAHLVFLSSYLYGVPDRLPITETARLHAFNPYALSKQLAEEACQFYSAHMSVNVTVLRPFNIYGPGQDARFLIPSIVEQVRAGMAVTVKDLEPKRDYVYIDDVTDAIVCAIERPTRFAVINIASGISHSVSEVIAVIQRIAETALPVRSDGERRKEEVMDTRADITRAREVLGWQPRWSLDEGCAKIIQHHATA
jgi:GDP-4-dehydro-6-deoxy-D-mannose reductase